MNKQERMMQIGRAAAAGASIFLYAVCSAQNIQTTMTPSVGESRTISPGEPIWTVERQSSVDVLTISAPVHTGTAFSRPGRIELPAGTMLQATETKKGKRFCQVEALKTMVGPLRSCLTDEDHDGRFDHYAGNMNFPLGVLPEQIPYEHKQLTTGDPRDLFQHVYIYSGASNGTLNLSYREFTGGLARPAFTEALSIPLAPTYPQLVRFKGTTIRIDGIDGLGMRYAVTEAAPQP